MSKEEEKEIIAGLTASRDELQNTLAEARQLRMELRLSNRDKFREFQQKLGELSFVFGAAIIPLVVVSQKDGHINHLSYLLAGVAVYLIVGFIALWRTKTMLEQDADDSPHVGLSEEIATYPLINALNKLLHDVHSEEYQKEYFQIKDVAIDGLTESEDGYKTRTNFTADILLSLFVLASLLVVRTVWPYDEWIYWEVFLVTIGAVLLLTLFSYQRTLKNQKLLSGKRRELASIRKKYQDWEASILKVEK